MNRSGFVIASEGEHREGLRDAEGREVLPCVYDKILDFDDDGYIRVLRDGVYATVDLEGHWVISHEQGLTHLGVFHQGSARARKDGKWALVDERGGQVTPFVYQSIGAFFKGHYKAAALNGVWGTLQPDGQFAKMKKQPRSRPRYREVRTYRNDVAPARTWSDKWIFIDRDGNRCSEYEYLSMDPVLRHGVYKVMSEKGYGLARYDGRPVVDEWFFHPLDFSDGLTPCCKRCPGADGKPLLTPEGQPRCLWGILNEKGEYVFPPAYSALHWNDYDTRDCWYAEDDNYSYLLYPDGQRRSYHKGQADRSSHCFPFIPATEKDRFIPADRLRPSYRPQQVAKLQACGFHHGEFEHALEDWAIKTYRNEYEKGKMNVYYRDTDAPLRADLAYARGTVVRAGSMLQVTSRLLRPVHKLRFYITARHMYSKDDGSNSEELKEAFAPLDFKQHFMHPDMCFVVMDVQQMSSVTQVVLFEIPHALAALAAKHRASLLTLVDETYLGIQVREAATHDLMAKMGAQVHGNSLSDYWNRAMRQPVGYSPRMRKTGMNRPAPHEGLTPSGRAAFDSCHAARTEAYDRKWREEKNFMRTLPRHVSIVVGDIWRMGCDAVVRGAYGSLLCDDNFLREGGERLLRACRQHGHCRTGQSKLTGSGTLSCGRLVHTVPPVWRGGGGHEDRLLANCYKSALRIAARRKWGSVAFPPVATASCGFPRERAAAIALRVLLRALGKPSFGCDVTVCCPTEQDAQVYLDCVGQDNSLPTFIIEKPTKTEKQ